jgi:hypothetical protein
VAAGKGGIGAGGRMAG